MALHVAPPGSARRRDSTRYRGRCLVFLSLRFCGVATPAGLTFGCNGPRTLLCRRPRESREEVPNTAGCVAALAPNRWGNGGTVLTCARRSTTSARRRRSEASVIGRLDQL